MWTIENSVGRLVEVQIASPIVAADLDPFGRRMATVLGRYNPTGQRVVACTDLSAAYLFAPEVAETFIRVMQRDNPVLERSAFLIGGSAMFALQVERMLKQASSPARRAFREIAPLLAWLGELLAPPEHERLLRFLADAGPKKP
jgi:hypothetical protein